MNHKILMLTPDVGGESRFFPREKLFWIVNILAWIFILDRVSIPGDSYYRLAEGEQSLLTSIFLGLVWLGYIAAGTVMVLLFRHFYYRQQWGERKLIATVPLAILLALLTGITMSFLIHLPVDVMLGTAFEIQEEGGAIFISGAFTYALYRSAALAVICLLWLLAYCGISASLNARELAFRALALENSLKGAQLNALSGQINSHFLFNALNNIRFMIARDAHRAEDSLVALSEILRHSLESSRNDKVLLAEELAITEKYLGLMQNQMQDKLQYSIQTDLQADNCLLPPMMVQMLAENAIKHGVDQISDGGRVDIHCSAVKGENGGSGTLRIEVRNTAISSNAETEDLSQSLPLQEQGEEKGLGLANISNRLALLYRKQAQISFSHLDNEFLVVIELPCERSV